jgi:hypothetical protein
MVTRVILDKIYNIPTLRRKKRTIRRYVKYLSQLTRGFEKTSIGFRKIREKDSRVEILINGPDEQFVKNLLEAELGRMIRFTDVKEGDILEGTLVEVGAVGFGLFVDCGILKPATDVLIPLYTVRNQLANGKKVSLPTIINSYDFITHFPLSIKVVEVDTQEFNIKGEIAEKTLALFRKILNEQIEGLFICGETKGQFKRALVNTGHLQDIITFKRYGFLEHLVLFKEDTYARGVIAEIGKSLEGCKFSVLNPERIKSLKEN